MRFLIKLMLIGISLTILSAEEKFLLIDGTVIQGEIISESDLSIIVQTKYGEITVEKSDLLQLEYEVQLNSGENFTGLKIADTITEIILKTNMGELTIQKSEILDIKEVDKITSEDESKPGKRVQNRRAYSVADMLFGTGSRSLNKDAEFALGEERLIDTFFDPRADVLEDGTLYLSGLSFAFGISEKLQVSSRWADYFWGNFNIRPKYQIFKKGNWERESALAIGGHFHTFWQPNKVVWKTGTTDICVQANNDNDSWTNCDDYNTIPKTVNYGGYFPMGASIKRAQDYHGNNSLAINETEALDMMFEFFTAYTFSKARKGMKGRISSTIGALVQIPLGYDEYPYRLFGSVDIDVTPQLKIIGEAFYDPYFLDINNRTNDENCFFFECMGSEHWTYKVSDNETDNITEDQFETIRPIHFDFGFMYAVNEHFRIGIHNQPYIVAFYWKF